MRKHAKKLVATAVVFMSLMVNDSFAPPPTGGGGGTGGGGAGCWPPPCIPIDGGISLLFLAGAAIAGKKLMVIRAV